MYGFLFKSFGLAIALLAALYGAGSAFRRARRLDARISEYKREQEEARSRGAALDPYSELAQIYSESKSTLKSKKETSGR